MLMHLGFSVGLSLADRQDIPLSEARVQKCRPRNWGALGGTHHGGMAQRRTGPGIDASVIIANYNGEKFIARCHSIGM